MNVKEYISSGIIESYVLGLASQEERNEFEKMCEQYPEVLEARIAFELSLEKQASQNAVAPPVEIKQQILTRISVKQKIVNKSATPVHRINWMKYAVAACVVLLAGTVYWSISLYNENQKLKRQMDESIAKVKKMENDMEVIRQNPNIKMAALKGTDMSPQSFATVYWDTTSKDVYLVINNLPQPPTDKQYQLWALLDGKPIDQGMIENKNFIRQDQLLIKMKNVTNAQAFAITLERMERTDTSQPEGDMYVMGKL